MKKIIYTIICFFILTISVNAAPSANSVEIDISLNKDGSAEVVEHWDIKGAKTYERFLDSDLKAKNIKVISTKKELEYIKKCELTKEYTYCTKNSYIKMKTSGASEKITITYTIPVFITSFIDKTGIKYDLITKKNNYLIKRLKVELTSEIKISGSNSKIFAIGENTDVSIEDDKLLIDALMVRDNNPIYLLVAFNNPLKMNAYHNINVKFNDYYNSLIVKDSPFKKIMDIIKKEILFVIIGTVLLALIVYGITKLLDRNKNDKEFKNFRLYDEDLKIPKMNEIPYYESVPCNGSLYKINFIASYFGVMKNKSNIVGAFLFKWISEGRCTIVGNKIRMSNRNQISNSYEKMLYDLLGKCTKGDNMLEEKHMKRMVYENIEEFSDWFQMIDKVVLDAEVSKGNIKKVKKNYIVQEKIYNEAKNIIGTKRYLLHFNQVPRKNALTENSYKSLLVCAVLFGIEEDVAKEILRKSKDNIFAEKLLEFSRLKSLYKGIYNEVKNNRSLIKINQGRLDNK